VCGVLTSPLGRRTVQNWDISYGGIGETLRGNRRIGAGSGAG
jgi:hypothetical protein